MMSRESVGNGSDDVNDLGFPNRPPSPSSRSQDDDTTSQKKRAVRKRTKTGCLTCRKRRIKCDEGRPTCNNCIKSKRQCDGYNQRVIFKEPMGAFAGAHYGPTAYPGPSPQALVREQQISAAQQRSNSQSLQIIAPKPSPAYHQPLPAPGFPHGYPTYPGLPVQPLNYGENPYPGPPIPSRYTFHPPETVNDFAPDQWRQSHVGGSQSIAADAHPHMIFDVPPGSASAAMHEFDGIGAANVGGLSQDRSYHIPPDQQADDEEYEYYDYEDEDSMDEFDRDLPLSEGQDPDMTAARLGTIIAKDPYNLVDNLGTKLRNFSAGDDILVPYEPSPFISPLSDRQFAQVFFHFVNVTGPSISLYERHPNNPSPLFQTGPAPKAAQHIWTYTCPIMAFRHSALLQAILAMGSLQIAKLQGVPPMASLRHYHLALRRIARNIGQPSKRAQPSNLAAILLLGYYEVWNSDHEKWTRHLLGARWIIKDIPYGEMTRAMMAAKIRQRQAQEEWKLSGGFHPFQQSSFLFEEPLQILHSDWDQIDVPLLRELSGRDVSYDEMGMVPEEISSYPRPTKHYTNKDFETYETLSDLYWWYVKMDVYQSILAGTRLFLEYHTWMQCPPRAPIGRLDAIYGTFDHLCIVLGRLSNFAYNDMVRKRRAQKAAGGPPGPPGPPPPGMGPGIMPSTGKVPTPAGFSSPQDESSPVSPPQPNQQQQQQQPRKRRKQKDTEPPPDLDTLTAAAHSEWESIRQAFETWRSHIGPEFSPLAEDLQPHAPVPTPFDGLPAVHYRTSSIAGIWMNYYMGLILLYRAHPSMPPIAMVAAGIQARHTAGFAGELARIAMGLEPDTSSLSVVSTMAGGSLIECCFPLFVAGIQLQDNAQRHWLVRRLHDIARLTGWQSARQIADGCETAWLKAASLNRGPPYERPADLNVIVVDTTTTDGIDATSPPIPTTSTPHFNDSGIPHRQHFNNDGVSEGQQPGTPARVKTRLDMGNPRNIDKRMQGMDTTNETQGVHYHDRHAYNQHQQQLAEAGQQANGEKIVLAAGEKAQYALGLLAVENVLAKLDLGAEDEYGDEEE